MNQPDGVGSLHPWRRFELLIFDFDGTLADSFHWFSAELNHVARSWGFREVAPENEALLRQMSADEIFRWLQVPRWKIPWIARDLRRRMARDIDRIGVFDGVAQMLMRFARSECRIALASSNAAANIQQVLGPDLCACIEASECGVALSGKSARLKRLCRKFGIRTDATLYIGDEVRDIVAARRAGVAAGAVTWGYNSEAALVAQRPDLLFRRVEQINPLSPATPIG
jgi:phosphoglycolate phosphatase